MGKGHLVAEFEKTRKKRASATNESIMASIINIRARGSNKKYFNGVIIFYNGSLRVVKCFSGDGPGYRVQQQ